VKKALNPSPTTSLFKRANPNTLSMRSKRKEEWPPFPFFFVFALDFV
jgi:hypothetical protein